MFMFELNFRFNPTVYVPRFVYSAPKWLMNEKRETHCWRFGWLKNTTLRYCTHNCCCCRRRAAPRRRLCRKKRSNKETRLNPHKMAIKSKQIEKVKVSVRCPLESTSSVCQSLKCLWIMNLIQVEGVVDLPPKKEPPNGDQYMSVYLITKIHF